MERTVNYIIKNEADEISIKALSKVRDTKDSMRNEGKSNGGEVFTPAWCVVDMGNLVDDKLRELKSTVLEPACGTGNILIDVVRRKLATAMSLGKEQYADNMLWAIKSVYGVDIESANAIASRDRIKKLVLNMYGWVFDSENGSASMPVELESQVDDILSKNIIWGDTLSNKDLSKNSILRVYNWQSEKWDYIKETEETRQMSLFDNFSTEGDDDEEVADF